MVAAGASVEATTATVVATGASVVATGAAVVATGASVEAVLVVDVVVDVVIVVELEDPSGQKATSMGRLSGQLRSLETSVGYR